ncbi:MAG: DJ-1/PfpI family protein [Candidatus Phytoplasma pyri]|uniref:DJ-1/PfpI family protein n=1 Tax=Candidatus Phytoplasma pyri TaxID=47566 RepID=UPI003983C507
MKGLLILYNGFEDCEALVTRAILKKNNFDIVTATNNKNLNVFSATRLNLKADCYLENIKYDDYNFLIIPGGPYVKSVINKNDYSLDKILDIVNHFYKNNKIIGAICAAPVFLGKLNLLKERKFSCYPGCETLIEGEYCPNISTVVSDNLITSRSPETVFDFAFTLIKKLN